MSKKNKKLFSIIIVNYESRDFLNQCLKSIDRFVVPILKEEFEVIVVNNDEENLSLENNFKFSLKILKNKENLGFGDANNKGTKIANGKYLFFLNPDTEFKNDSFEKVVDFLKKQENENIILGLKILEIDKPQDMSFRLERSETEKSQLLGKQPIQEWSCGYKTSFFGILSRNRFAKKPWLNDEVTRVDWVSGCAMIVGKKLFEKIGGFDDNFFMYFEDQDLCLRAEAGGAKVFYFPLGEVFHWGGQSWDEKSEQKKEYFKSQDYFFVKYFWRWQGWVLRFIRWIFK